MKGHNKGPSRSSIAYGNMAVIHAAVLEKNVKINNWAMVLYQK